MSNLTLNSIGADARRAWRQAFYQDFLTPLEFKHLHQRFRRDMQTLRRHLAAGPAWGESKDDFLERMVRGLETVLERYPNLTTGLRTPGRRAGRPPRIFEMIPAAPKGRPLKITAESKALFLAEIDRCRVVLDGGGERVTDAAALRMSMGLYFHKRLRKSRTPAEAKRLAEELASGKHYRTRLRLLRELRSRAKSTAK